jgi:7,8-dihydropterin-6-yl-methyl-4-(beta-D-ribofuranosyl)aminobenzene 5'-phosphate synthase
VLDRRALKAANLSVTYAEGPSLIADHGFTTGQIGLRSFEKVLSPTAMKVGLEKGLGCYADKLPEDERVQRQVPDQFRHEIATVFNLRGKGLILLTSCSHRGVVNAVREAQAVSGIDKVHAVIGGFHLAPYPPEYVQQTVAALREINVEHVIPLHCTGEPFYDLARADMPGKVLRSYTGTRLAFV